MEGREIHAVTGAFGFTGKYIARRLLDEGMDVITLTNSLHRRNPFGERVQAHPFNFDRPERLQASLEGVSVLYNTYWVRFNYDGFSFSSAIENVKRLFESAKNAGVERIVHISITNPSEDSPLQYFSGKAKLEKSLIETGLSHAILRPAVLFGKEDILINNIAWLLRNFPVFGVFGDGGYRLQPIFVDDLAKLAVDQGRGREDRVLNAIGPETFTYRELVESIGDAIGMKRPIVSIPPSMGLLAAKIIGKATGDVLITRDEIEGLTSGLLYVDAPPAGNTRLTDWAKEHADSLGKEYASELDRRLEQFSKSGGR